jgi:hypothetical protein
MLQRNEVYAKRFNINKPIYINEDLPFTVRRDHGVMRQKKKQLMGEGYTPKEIKMDWGRKTVKTADDFFVVKEGKICDSSSSGPDIQSSSSNMTGVGGKKKEKTIGGSAYRGSQAQDLWIPSNNSNNSQNSLLSGNGSQRHFPPPQTTAARSSVSQIVNRHNGMSAQYNNRMPSTSSSSHFSNRFLGLPLQ